jgi:hypothetical protein
VLTHFNGIPVADDGTVLYSQAVRIDFRHLVSLNFRGDVCRVRCYQLRQLLFKKSRSARVDAACGQYSATCARRERILRCAGAHSVPCSLLWCSWPCCTPTHAICDLLEGTDPLAAGLLRC